MSSSPNSSSSSDGGKLPEGPLGWVLDVPCPVEFVLGTATVTVRDCIEFQRDSLVRLRQAAGTDLEIRVSGIPIAAGEVVIVAENLGIRLTKVLPPGSAEPA